MTRESSEPMPVSGIADAADRPPVDYLKMHEFTSSIAINMLTLNHGNLTRNPKLDNREVYNMPMKDRPIVKMMMQNSAHILCLNEADAFFSPNDEKIQGAHQDVHPIRLQGHRDQAMVIQTDRMLCPWRTFCKSGTSGKTHFHQDPELGNRNPTSDCLATTGPSVFTESKKYIGPRLPTRTIVQGHGRDKEIVVLHIEQSDEFRGMIPKSSNKSLRV